MKFYDYIICIIFAFLIYLSIMNIKIGLTIFFIFVYYVYEIIRTKKIKFEILFDDDNHKK